MNTTKKIPVLACAALLAMAGLLSGCEADGNDEGQISGGGDGSDLPNDGTTPTTVTDGGPPEGGGSHEVIDDGNFVCTKSVKRYGANPTTEVAANGVVGAQLSELLDTLGGTTVTRLLASVVDKDLAIDSDLDTFSRFTLAADLGFGALTSVDQVVFPESPVPKGNYAVFGVTFPGAVLELSLLQTLRVTTFRREVPQETMTLTRVDLDLLGQVLAGGDRAFLGIKTTRSYDAASIGIAPALGADVGDALHVHELCVKGKFVDPPTP